MDTTVDGKRIKYYCIHNRDEIRKKIMLEQFEKSGFNLENIEWVTHPNANELTEELLDEIIIKEPSYSCEVFIPPERTRSKLGLVSCTYKHYCALKDIIDKKYDYGVIIEDNIGFMGNIPELINTYIDQLNNVYGDWDIVFDRNWAKYDEGPIKPGLFVYPKSNAIKYHSPGVPKSHGGSRSATFYLVKRECAEKLVPNYLPFNNSPDWWMNDLFRKLDIKSFWVEPNRVFYPNRSQHKSSCK